MQATYYEQDTKLAHYWAHRYRRTVDVRNDIDLEDLQQAAFLGIMQARKRQEDTTEGFITYAGFYARNEIRSLLGIRNGKLPPAMESLDEPVDDDSDATRLDLLADETLPEPDADLLEEEKRQTVRDAVARLKDEQKNVVDLRFFQDKTVPQVADIMQINRDRVRTIWDSAKRSLYKDPSLWHLASRSTQYMRHVGKTQFNTTMTSAVEYLVILREQLNNKVQTGARL